MTKASASPHVTERHTYSGFSRAEQAFGLFWLSLGALVSLLLEIVYLGTWIGPVPVPYTIIIAFFFNQVLTKTARLWNQKVLIALIPLIVWGLGYFLFTLGEGVTGDQLLGSNLRSLVLLFAGVAGGVWPIIRALDSVKN